MTGVKAKLKYISGTLMLLSIGIIFVPLLNIGVAKISMFDMMKIVFGKYKENNIADQLLTILNEYMKKYIYSLLLWVVLAILIVILMWVLNSVISYIIGICGQAVNIFLALMLYQQVQEKLAPIKELLSIFDQENSIGIDAKVIFIWCGMQVLILCLNIAGILVRGEKKKKHSAAEDMIYVPPVASQKERDIYPDEEKEFNNSEWREEKRRAVYDDVFSDSQFFGAVLGVQGRHKNEAFPLSEKEKVAILQTRSGIEVERSSEVQMSGKILAELYYIPEYEEYCICPKQKRTIYLESGQPLGAERLYYLPRAMRIEVKDSSSSETAKNSGTMMFKLA